MIKKRKITSLIISFIMTISLIIPSATKYSYATATATKSINADLRISGMATFNSSDNLTRSHHYIINTPPSTTGVITGKPDSNRPIPNAVVKRSTPSSTLPSSLNNVKSIYIDSKYIYIDFIKSNSAITPSTIPEIYNSPGEPINAKVNPNAKDLPSGFIKITAYNFDKKLGRYVADPNFTNVDLKNNNLFDYSEIYENPSSFDFSKGIRTLRLSLKNGKSFEPNKKFEIKVDTRTITPINDLSTTNPYYNFTFETEKRPKIISASPSVSSRNSISLKFDREITLPENPDLQVYDIDVDGYKKAYPHDLKFKDLDYDNSPYSKKIDISKKYKLLNNKTIQIDGLGYTGNNYGYYAITINKNLGKFNPIIRKKRITDETPLNVETFDYRNDFANSTPPFFNMKAIKFLDIEISDVKVFDQNDNLTETKLHSDIATTSTIDNIYNQTPITISFKDKETGKPLFLSSIPGASAGLANIITLTKGGTNIPLSNIFDVSPYTPAFFSSPEGFDKIVLKPKLTMTPATPTGYAFLPDGNYEMKIDINRLQIIDKFSDNVVKPPLPLTYQIYRPAGLTPAQANYKYVLNIEKRPEVIDIKNTNDSITLVYDRKIERNMNIPDAIKIYKYNSDDFNKNTTSTEDSSTSPTTSPISPTSIPIALTKNNISFGDDEKSITISGLDYGFYLVDVDGYSNTTKAPNKFIYRKIQMRNEVPVEAKEFNYYNFKKDNNIKQDILLKTNNITDSIKMHQYNSSNPSVIYQKDSKKQADLERHNKHLNLTLNNEEIETDKYIELNFSRPFRAFNDLKNNITIKSENGKTVPIRYITTTNPGLSGTYPSALTGTSTSVTTNPFSTIYLTLDDLLEPETQYTLTIDTKNLVYDISVNPTSTTGNKKPVVADQKYEVYGFKTETRPKIRKVDYQPAPTIDAKETDQNFSIEFDKPIEIINSNKINSQVTILGKNAKNTIARGNVLNFTIDKSIAKNLYARNVSVDIASNALKRNGSQNVNVSSLSYKLGVDNDKINQIDQYKDDVANAIAHEMEKRYQAEYGTDSDFLSFNDYVKEKYIKNLNKPYVGQDYIQLYLKEKGYVDDFISKYGRDPMNLETFAEDYMNRYGEFAFNKEDSRTNPFFMNAFDDYSHKYGYYDYYNIYDYGYKYPEIRRGDDYTNQATREKQEALDQKLISLTAQEKALTLNNGQNYTVGGFLSPKIVIDINNRYMTYFDKYGNMTTEDMGTAPYKYSNRLFVPIAKIASKSGMWVDYNNKTKQTTLSRPGIISAFTLNSSYITINSNSENMGIRPLVRQGKTLIPVHYLQKALGLPTGSVNYDIASGKIEINNF